MKSEVCAIEGEGDGRWKGGKRCGAFDLGTIPHDCIAAVLSFTFPRDACRLSLSTAFKSASESDAVWERFLPSDYKALIPSSLCFSSKKQLYLSLCENPVLIDGGRKSLSLERGSGKKCYMLSARDLFIAWSDTPDYWEWVSISESRNRFEEVAELIEVCWFDIRGKITVSILSPMTNYKAYLVFKETTEAFGFDCQPVEVSVGLVGTEGCRRTANLDAKTQPTEASDVQYPKARGDGWLEIELGEFFNDGLCIDRELEMSVSEKTVLWWKGGILIQGIEIRA